MTDQTNARITEREAIVRNEVVAPRIEIFWEPTTNAGKVVFHMQRIDSVDGMEASRVDIGRMEHSFDAIIGRTFHVHTGLTDDDGMPVMFPVSTTLLMGAIKTAFDVLYNERHAPAPPEPTEDVNK